jgi:hypothetical protein
VGRLKLIGEQEGGDGGGTDDHSALSNLAYDVSGHTGFVPSQGEALIDILRLNQNLIRDSEGNDRITLSAASPHVTLGGDIKITGNVAVAGAAPAPQYGVLVQPSPAPELNSWVGVAGNPQIRIPSGSTLGGIKGLDFTCSISQGGEGTVLPLLEGTRTRISTVSYTGTVTDARGVHIPFPFLFAGNPSISTWTGVYMASCNRPQIVDAYGLFIGDITNNSGFSRLLEIGADTPYLRLVGGGDPPANKSNLYLKFGSTLYRVVKSGSYMTLEAA